MTKVFITGIAGLLGSTFARYLINQGGYEVIGIDNGIGGIDENVPEKEIQKEKEIVIDEINSYLDAPSDKIFDDFEALLFQNHSLGTNILGTKESVA